MASIRLQNVSALFDEHFWLKDINWQVRQGEHWVIVGPNGAGKSALGASLAGEGDRRDGQLHCTFHRPALVSFEQLSKLLDEERKKDAADILDVVPVATRARELLFAESQQGREYDVELCDKLFDIFAFTPLLERDFNALSTGETRKLLLIRALIYRPDLLILDEPFDGLDAKSTHRLAEVMEDIKGQTTLIMVLNRLDEVPPFISHFVYMEEGQIKQQLCTEQGQIVAELKQLLHLKTTGISIPAKDESCLPPPLAEHKPLVDMHQVAIRYGDKTIFEKLDWRIDKSQHWQLSGPNGCGKTCLLNLITGDHPQCYSNNIKIFGFQRGSGESIWQIKQYLGFVSNSLHQDHRVATSALNTIISGFFDSIGLYQQPSDKQKAIAGQWLQVLGMQHQAHTPFNQLSYGAQRLLLIARAMVKHPPLLILDEPCQGLDDMNRQLVLALIERICAFETSAVIYVNHHAKDKIKGIDRQLDLSAYNPV